tara:strand:- start:2084 stop:2791 length:708 start_codon:yes stop_codon:yes gene_type:complete
VPKKKKTKKKMYFGMEVQDAIVRYNALDADKDRDERNKIYGQEIHAAFDKLSENIINTFKFEYFDDVYLDVKHEVVAFMVMNMHKYDHSKGSKAFSYFSVVAKNYLILHNNANYKKYKMHTGIDILNSKSTSLGRDNYYNELTEEIIKYFENNINSLFKTDKDISIAYAIVELMKTRDGIENFNKKSLYVLIREMTNVETSYITKVVNVFKREYKKVLIEFEKVGYISNKKNKFF